MDEDIDALIEEIEVSQKELEQIVEQEKAIVPVDDKTSMPIIADEIFKRMDANDKVADEIYKLF